MAQTHKLLTDVATNTTGDWLPINANPITVSAGVVGTGAVSVTVTLEVAHDQSLVFVHGTTLSLSGTTSDVDALTITGQWNYIRAKTSSISGTGATVNVAVCQQRDTF